MRWLLFIFILSSCLRHPRPDRESFVPDPVSFEISEKVQNRLFKEVDTCEPWWAGLSDEMLKGTIQKALDNNPQSLMADARVRLTKAEALFYGARMLPTIDFEADMQNERISKNGIFGIFPGIPFNYRQYETAFQFGYEFDFWEKNQNRMRAAIGEHEAAWAEREEARLVLSISIADAYWQYLILRQREEAYGQVVAMQRRLVEIEEARRKGNLSNDLIILPLKEALGSYEAALHKVTHNKEAAYYKFQSLVNPDFDEPIEIKELGVSDYLPLPIPLNLHLDLLHQRPDLTALKWRVEARDRERLSAQAEFFPDFQFIGLVGLQTIIPQRLLRGDSLYGNWGPAVNLPIFRGGAISANYLARDEETLMAILDYEQGVRDAVAETLTALTDTIEINERYEANKRREADAAKYETLIQARRKNNLGTAQEEIRSAIETYRAKDEKLKMEGLLFRALLDVIRSVGGNYHE